MFILQTWKSNQIEKKIILKMSLISRLPSANRSLQIQDLLFLIIWLLVR